MVISWDSDFTRNIHYLNYSRIFFFLGGGLIYLLTLCFVFLAADGVGPRNVVSVVVNIIILVV